jgi:hypothetical protein
MTDDDTTPTHLSVLPEGSACDETKNVPARSSYWKDDTDSVTRCDKYSTPESGSDDDSDDSDDETDDDMPSLPENVNGWLLRRGPGDDGSTIQYVAETPRHMPAKWKHTDRIVQIPEVVFSRGNATIRIHQYNISEDEKETTNGGLTKTTYKRRPEKAVETLLEWLRDHDADRHFAPPEPNGFVSVTASRKVIDWLRSEVPESVDYDGIAVQCTWKYTADEAPEMPYWDVKAWKTLPGGDRKAVETVEENISHVKRAVRVAQNYMEDVTFEADPPDEVGGWQLESESRRQYVYGYDTGEKVLTAGGSRKTLFKYVVIKQTAGGWAVRLFDGYRNDDPSDFDRVDEVTVTETEVAAVDAAVEYMNDRDFTDESLSPDDVEFPESVNGWESEETNDDLPPSSTSEVVAQWGAQNDSAAVYIAETSGRYGDRWETGVSSVGGLGGVSLAGSDDIDEALDTVTSYMSDTPPDLNRCFFEVDAEDNYPTTPAAELIQDLGGRDTTVEYTNDPPFSESFSDDTGAVVLKSGGHGSRVRVVLPDGVWQDMDVTKGGKVVADTGVLDVWDEQNKSDTAGLSVQSDYRDSENDHVVASAGGVNKSEVAKGPYTDTFRQIPGDKDDARFETTGRELRAAIKAVTIPTLDEGRRDYDVTAMLDVSEDGVALVYEGNSGDRVKAKIGELEDDVKFSGSASIPVRIRWLRELQTDVPGPASTTVSFHVYETGHIDASFMDSGGMYQVWLPVPDEKPDFDLSAPARLVTSKCGANGIEGHLNE